MFATFSKKDHPQWECLGYTIEQFVEYLPGEYSGLVKANFYRDTSIEVDPTVRYVMVLSVPFEISNEADGNCEVDEKLRCGFVEVEVSRFTPPVTASNEETDDLILQDAIAAVQKYIAMRAELRGYLTERFGVAQIKSDLVQ